MKCICGLNVWRCIISAKRIFELIAYGQFRWLHQRCTVLSKVRFVGSEAPQLNKSWMFAGCALLFYTWFDGLCWFHIQNQMHHCSRVFLNNLRTMQKIKIVYWFNFYKSCCLVDSGVKNKVSGGKTKTRVLLKLSSSLISSPHFALRLRSRLMFFITPHLAWEKIQWFRY